MKDTTQIKLLEIELSVLEAKITSNSEAYDKSVSLDPNLSKSASRDFFDNYYKTYNSLYNRVEEIRNKIIDAQKVLSV